MKILTELWDFFKINFKFLIVALAIVIVYLNGCFDRFKPQAPIVTIVHDTTIVSHDTIIYDRPTIITSISPKPTEIPPTLIPDTNYYKLKAQFEQLRTDYLTKNISTDTQKVDSIGKVTVTDTTYQNKIIGRKWDIDIKERIITNTITIAAKLHNQVYYGGGLSTIPNTNFINQVKAGLLFKNKKDVIIGINGLYDFNKAKFGAEASLYKKF